ncbi:MAG: ABC transporter permease [Thermoanaerobaculia bacterium]
MLTSLQDLYRHRALVGVLTTRELKARYRGSVLGFFWSLLNPLLMLGVYTLVFQYVMPNRSASMRPYALFLFTGLLPWNWLAASLTDASGALPTHGSLLRKILFPAEVLPLVAVLAQGVHFLLGLPILLAGLVLAQFGFFEGTVTFGLPLLQVPLLLVIEGLFLLGLGFFLSALTVHFRDVRDLLTTAIPLWFFATPILYSLKDLKPGRITGILKLNPVAPLFAGWHDALFFGRWISPAHWGLMTLIAVVTFVVGFAFFDRLRDSFAEAV